VSLENTDGRLVAKSEPGRYPLKMGEPVNLTDPEFEPSDEDLVGLSTRAFAGVRTANTEIVRKLRAEIEVARERAVRRLEDIEAARAKR